jgi:hypothetical protein
MLEIPESDLVHPVEIYFYDGLNFAPTVSFTSFDLSEGRLGFAQSGSYLAAARLIGHWLLPPASSANHLDSV